MYGKVKIAGHPMLAAFPVACYVGALAGFAVHAANGTPLKATDGPRGPRSIG